MDASRKLEERLEHILQELNLEELRNVCLLIQNTLTNSYDYLYRHP